MKLDLKETRKHLHKNPELSGNEKETSKYIAEVLQQFSPDKIITQLGGNGIAAIFNSEYSNRTIMFRAELDALPITESNEFSYKSKTTGISHKCGHDGHMTILLGLAARLKQKKIEAHIILLFQPAEETAGGAEKILKDKRFNFIKPDHVFALHNLPGFTKGSIILREGIFSSTSLGLIITLEGETSHAGHPENGNNPVTAMTSIINELTILPSKFREYALITIIYAKLGEIAFGTSPGKAVIMATFRAHTKEDLTKLQNKAETYIRDVSAKQKLKLNIKWVEYFPEIVNDNDCVDLVSKAAKKLNKKVIYRENPFTWTEDFSYFTQKIKGAFFGLGAGKNHAQLHNSDYDFPDEIIEDGVNVFWYIIEEICRRS